MPGFPLKKSMFMRADRAAPSAWFAHIPFAGWLIESTRPRVLVELGTHYGTSYLAFCQALVLNEVDCKAFAVDTWAGDEHAGEYGEEVFEQLDAYHGRKYGGFSELLRMTFDEAADYFEDGSIDLLHVDGLHTYEAVKHDFETWFPKLSDRAIVLFHDTCVRERGFGVWRFWAEVEKQFDSFEFTHGHGLGVLSLGNGVSSQLAPLFTHEADTKLARSLFERLGSCIEVDAELERVNRALVHQRFINRERTEKELTEIRASFDSVRHDVVHVQNSLRADLTKVEQALDGIHSQCTAIGEAASTRAGMDVLRKELVQFSTESQLELLRNVDVLRRDLVTVRAQLLQESASAFANVHEDMIRFRQWLAELDSRTAGQQSQASMMLETLMLRLQEIGEALEEREQRRWSRKLGRLLRGVPPGAQGHK